MYFCHLLLVLFLLQDRSSSRENCRFVSRSRRSQFHLYFSSEDGCFEVLMSSCLFLHMTEGRKQMRLHHFHQMNLLVFLIENSSSPVGGTFHISMRILCLGRTKELQKQAWFILNFPGIPRVQGLSSCLSPSFECIFANKKPYE